MRIEKNKAAYIEAYKDKVPSFSSNVLSITDEFYVREELVKKGMFALITTDFADNLANYLKGKRVLEVMAGAGYLAYELQNRGVDIVATDNYSWGIHAHNDFPIENLSVYDAIRKYSDVDYILVSWIPMNDAATDLIRAVKKYCPDKLILHIGEGQSGCTGNDYFFNSVKEVFDNDLLQAQNSFEHFYGIHDELSLLKLKHGGKKNVKY